MTRLWPATLPYVDYAFFSLKPSEAESFLADAWRQGPKVVVGTLGVEGSSAYDGERFYHFGIFPAQVENTVGAGDAFIAGFMAEVLRGKGLEEALRGGARVAAEVVEVFEPWVKK